MEVYKVYDSIINVAKHKNEDKSGANNRRARNCHEIYVVKSKIHYTIIYSSMPFGRAVIKAISADKWLIN
jgi:hypothetical protein